MAKLKKLNPITLQQQLYDEILNDIKTGKYKTSDKIPTEYQLSETYQVSRVTVRAAIQQLVDQNILIKKAGKGTFVRSPLYTEVIFKGGSFTENCLQRNAKPSTKIIEAKIDDCPSNDFSSLASKENKIIIIKRIRFVDDIACIVEVDYLPTSFDFLLLESNKDSSFLKIIAENTGLMADQFIDKFSISFANKEFASYLSCPIGTPLLKVSQTIKDANDQIIYMNDQFILSEKYVYVKTSK